MKILFCRIGWSASYNGDILDKPVNGGAYNKDKIGHEIHNYKSCNGKYFGYVQSRNGSINLQNLGGSKSDECVHDVLVVWVSKKSSGGQVIVGWYKNATVYGKPRNVPDFAMEDRKLKDHNFFNILSEDAYLLPEDKRTYVVEGLGQSNVWYGNDDVKKRVEDYVNKYSEDYDQRISQIEINAEGLLGSEKDAIVKARINQDKFRDRLLKKYGKCCLCGIQNPDLLIASHLKPWSQSDKREKLDAGNGLLLCPNHDKLIDGGFVSFDNSGKIIISSKLSDIDRILMNIRDDMKIEVTEENLTYVSYHREKIFKK